MTLLSITYALFLLSVLGIYWSFARQELRLWTLLIASLVFYASLQVAYVPLMLIVVVINYWLGLAIGESASLSQQAVASLSEEDWQFAQQDWNQRRLKTLWVGIILNILLLISFKYVPFLLGTVGTWFNLADVKSSASWVSASLVAPLGLSFFCFECIAYLIDVYRGAPATREFLPFAAYKLFFPKLISGPITRYQPFLTQLQTQTFPKPERISEGLWLIACGAVKKGLIADRLNIFVNLSFDNMQRAGSGDLWLATFAYGLQLYLDFSGYVDIVRGSAILLGFDLPENFDFPYFSANIATFWRRWHMTLGDWLRNYLYFPLGGSRKGLLRTCVNLMIIMLIAGIWHGAAWGFVVWGALHGLALVLHRLTDTQSAQFPWLKSWWQSWPGVALAWLLTQVTVFTCWIFFRLPNLKDSGWVIAHLWGHQADAQFVQKVYVDSIGLEPLQLAIVLWVLVALMAVAYAVNQGLKLQLSWTMKIMLVPLCLYAVWLLSPDGSPPYIYFDF